MPVNYEHCIGADNTINRSHRQMLVLRH